MRFDPMVKIASHKSFATFIQGNKVFPINVEISPAGTCNAKCPWCFYSGTHKPVFLKTDTLMDAVFEMENMGVKAITWTGGGEPTLHPDFPEFTKRIKELTSIKQGLITNALLPPQYNPAVFEWIRVSYTPSGWKPSNIALLRACRALGLCINDTGDPKPIWDGLKVAKELGADYVQTRPALEVKGKLTSISPPTIDDPLLFKTPYKYKEAGETRKYDTCYGFNFVPFIWEDSEVGVCAYHRGKQQYVLGNLYEHGFQKIMEAAPRSVPTCDTCQICCKNHEINKVINRAFELKDGDFV